MYTAEPSPTVDYRAKLREMAEQNAGVSSEEADDLWGLIGRDIARDVLRRDPKIKEFPEDPSVN